MVKLPAVMPGAPLLLFAVGVSIFLEAAQDVFADNFSDIIH